jgi:two-component system cell cycle response regulator
MTKMANNVLVIEDNPANLELMLYLLRAYGFEATGCQTGADGMEKAQTCDFDLILCDIQLPDIDGVEIARALKLDRRPPLVAVTALAMIGDRDRLLAAGFDGYISKPIDPKAFVETVKGFLPEGKRLATRTVPDSSGVAAVPQRPQQTLARREIILVVDDLDANRYLLQTFLKSAGFQVIEAGSAKEGANKALEAHPNMIICDVNMPLEDGEKFLALLKAHPEMAEVPVLMVTSSDNPTQQTKERLRDAGAVGLLMRPIESAVLLQLIEKELAKGKGIEA